MRKWLTVLVVATAVMLSVVPAQASTTKLKTQVMTQNLYIGADLTRLLGGEPPAAILETVQQTNFAERAVTIAETIDKNDPDLVGLQEVSSIVVFDSIGNILLELDYLEILMNELDDADAGYAVGSSVTNANVTLPVDLTAGVFARVVDRDVILYRTSTTTVSNPLAANFETNFLVELGGVAIEFTRGYTAVDARVKGTDIRFVNTHLEVEDAPCLTPTGLIICQDAQAAELATALAEEPLPTILVGDFNAEPEMTAYETIIDAGYVDSWTVGGNGAPGFTCCQSEELLNPGSQLTQRIDHLFVADNRVRSFKAKTKILGATQQDKTPSGLWYSDHAGVWAQLNLTIDNP